MKYILSIIGIVGSFYLIRYRESIADSMGEEEWMRKLGGVHTLIVLIAIIIFFWSVAELTGTTSILFAPLTFLFPGLRGGGEEVVF